jgi:hypothetical protein
MSDEFVDFLQKESEKSMKAVYNYIDMVNKYKWQDQDAQTMATGITVIARNLVVISMLLAQISGLLANVSDNTYDIVDDIRHR